jgi:penicillin amidase
VPIPGADILDVRSVAPPARATRAVTVPVVGSNNWAVGGQLTSTGAALVANDMHLGIRVPNTWYRTQWTYADAAMPGGSVTVTGVTLPGAPLLVAGSNGHIAWGFTNSYGAWLDVERSDCTAVAPQQMTTPAGVVPLSRVAEQIKVHGAADVLLDVQSGPAGVLLRADPDTHECWFGSWLAQQPAATNMNLMQFERVTVVPGHGAGPEVGIPTRT